jgi:hypothetical protein
MNCRAIASVLIGWRKNRFPLEGCPSARQRFDTLARFGSLLGSRCSGCGFLGNNRFLPDGTDVNRGPKNRAALLGNS